MSSLASPHGRGAPTTGGTRPSIGVLRLPLGADQLVGLALALGLGLIAFITTGGVDLGPNTWTEIALVFVGAALGVATLVLARPARPWGGVTLLLFAAVAALTALSIAWSVQPANSWIEANRTLSYLAVFSGAIALARLFPERWPAVVGAIAVLATALSAWALLVKVFPGAFDQNDLIGRVRAPFDYWNATGLIAALGLPACVWAGARTDRGRALRALSVPAISLLTAVVILSYSRSATLAAIVGLALWFVLVPLRLRGAAILASGFAGGIVVTAWALATHALTHDRQSLPARISAGRGFGLLLVLVIVVMTGVGFAVAFAIDRAALTPDQRRRTGAILLAILALAPVGGIVALAASPRGLTGEISHVWTRLTNPNSGVGDSPSRLVELGNSRPRYWSEGIKVGDHALLKGVGAAGYGTARTRYSNDRWVVEHAHSYAVEVFADFGLIGLALNLALLLAWAMASGRTLGLHPTSRRAPTRAPPADRGAERAGLLTLLCIVVVFGINSAVDWTWFVPGTAIPALLCAGWLAGRGPLGEPVGRRSHRRASPGVAAAAAVISALTLLAAWAVWQPLRSADAGSAAITALSQGNTQAAISDAHAAAARDPVDVNPLWELSAIYDATGDHPAAHAELVNAVHLQPDNAATWQQLGGYNLDHGDPRAALSDLLRALSLDRSSRQLPPQIAQARSQIKPGASTTTP